MHLPALHDMGHPLEPCLFLFRQGKVGADPPMEQLNRSGTGRPGLLQSSQMPLSCFWLPTNQRVRAPVATSVTGLSSLQTASGYHSRRLQSDCSPGSMIMKTTRLAVMLIGVSIKSGSGG